MLVGWRSSLPGLAFCAPQRLFLSPWCTSETDISSNALCRTRSASSILNSRRPANPSREQGPTDLPFNLWTFLSLPSLYFALSLLLLGLVLFFCLFAPGHQPFSWDVAILCIPIPVLSTGLSLLVTLIPCSLVARNFQVLSQAIEPPTPAKPSESKPMDPSSPSVLESTELVTSENVLGLVPTAAHVVLGYACFCFAELKSHNAQTCPSRFSLAFLSIGVIYNDPIRRISLITAITAAFFAILLHLQASLQLLVRRSLPSQFGVA